MGVLCEEEKGVGSAGVPGSTASCQLPNCQLEDGERLGPKLARWGQKNAPSLPPSAGPSMPREGGQKEREVSALVPALVPATLLA